MTREEAIQILADLIDSPFLHTWEKQNKALHMAIEALSAEAVHKPDYSYEADMVRRLREYEQGYRQEQAEDVTNGRLIDADALSKKLCETTIFIKDGEAFQRMINDAPTVQAKTVQGWRTGKPTKSGKYIVTLIGIGDYRFVGIMHYDKPIMPNREVDGTCWYMDDDEWGDVVYDDKDILAWMPLPTPYKGGDDK